MSAPRKSNVPQTQQQPQRGRTVGAAGPTYYMPGTTNYQGRPGQYTRQKPRLNAADSALGAGQPGQGVNDRLHSGDSFN